jgi:RNA polymerase sigma factor (sigma-70 family)
MATDLCGDIERFQQGNEGFGKVWGQIEGFVSKEVLKGLRQRLVRGWKTADDLAAHDDIVQAVSVKLQKLPERPESWFDPERFGHSGSAICGWLGTICRNEVVSYCRTWRGAGRKLKQQNFTGLQLNESVRRGPNAREPLTAERMVEQAELMAILNDCLEALPPEQRQAIDLHYLQQLDVREAGRQIGTAPSTITKRAQAAFARLRKLLGERGVEG